MHNLLNSAGQLLAAVDLSSYIEGMNGEDRTLVVAMILGTVVGIVAIIGSTINRMHRRNAEIALKQDMLDRGLSADEIERVLAAKSPDLDRRRRWHSVL
jgi:hypothetical protein